MVIFFQVAVAQVKQSLSPVDAAYINTTLGLRYTRPAEMQDTTEASKAQIRALAEKNHVNNSFDLRASITFCASLT